MEKQDFEDWIFKYTPDGDYEDFVDRLAIGCIAIIEEASKRTKMTIPEIVDRYYYGGVDRQDVQ